MEVRGQGQPSHQTKSNPGPSEVGELRQLTETRLENEVRRSGVHRKYLVCPACDKTIGNNNKARECVACLRFFHTFCVARVKAKHNPRIGYFMCEACLKKSGGDEKYIRLAT